MKCPWTRYTQRETYNKTFDNSLKDTETTEIVTSQFGECVRTECPFFELRTNNCKRCK